jgi:hypothetical protein
MTIATFPQELFKIPEFSFFHQQTLLADELDAAGDSDLDTSVGVRMAAADVRKVANTARVNYNWSDRDFEDLLDNIHHPNFKPNNKISQCLIMALSGFHQAYLAGKSSEQSFWLTLDTSKRNALFAYASKLHGDLSSFNKLSSFEQNLIWDLSLSCDSDLAKLFADYQDNCAKFIGNTLRVVSIFADRESKPVKVLNFSAMKQEERDAAIENYKKARQKIVDDATLSELEESDRQFESAFKLIEESRDR